MECATPPYVEFFETRPGRIFFEYLNRPGEVSSLISGGYPGEATIAVLLPISVTALMFRKIKFEHVEFSFTWRLLVLIPLLLALLLGARSTLGHRPVNPATFASSSDPLVNDIQLSSSYKLLYAIYSLRHEEDSANDYPEMSDAEVLATYKESQQKNFISSSTTHHQFGDVSKTKHKNIVIIVEESLGARFVGSLDGLPLTPELDKWSKRGMWFTNLFATGIRSARGLEAITTGFPPSSARSVLKLSKSQRDFYTVANTVKNFGYHSAFVYGGEGHFDNMKGFFLNNGFDEAIDINDYDEWTFKGTWGVSDEDLFARAHQLMSEQAGPFLTLIFTSSFHSPYEFPDDRIELYEEPKASKHNAVKYADYALGKYLETAEQSGYWQDTVFLIVADHDERPRGFSLVPISSYHIPGLILMEGMTPSIQDKITSHIDLLPTVLSLAGLSGIAPWVGHDMATLADDDPGRALMQFGQSHAYMAGNQVVIHRPEKEPAQFSYTRGKPLEPGELQPELAKKALSWALLPGLLYQNQRYTGSVPPK
jgi:phosphoglycerol transferase MdoB-like AlkP superfamily enzyme